MALLPELRPFRELESLFDREFIPFVPVWQETMPSVNLYETDNAVVAEFSLPGMQAKDIEIELENDVLTVRGESKQEQEEKGRHYYRREFSQRRFSRSLTLPVEVQADKAKAEMKNGVLQVTIPKAESAKRKKVKVAVK